MTSVKRQLLAWLLPLYVGSAIVAMLVSYRQYEASIGAFMDGQIHALANSQLQQLAISTALPPVRSVDEEHIQHAGTPVIQFWTRDGKLLASSSAVPALGLQSTTGPHTVVAGGNWRTYTLLSSPVSVQILQSNEFRHRVMLDSAWKSAEPVLLLIPLSVVLLWLAVYRALRPLDHVVQTITRQDERNFVELPLEKAPAELIPLIESMNGLLARLQEAFATQQRFVQDAAHELRTPLAALVLQAERLRGKVGGTALEELDRLEAGIQRLHRLVDQLLKLARQEASGPRPEPGLVDLRTILKDCVSELLPLADQRQIDLGFKVFDESRVCTDVNDLRSIFDNILDNALRYTPAGGSVDVSLQSVSGEVTVEFADTGPGISPALLDRVFDRFYRVVGNTAHGSGLGLSIARSAALRGGISVELMNRQDRSGLLARVRLPRTT